MSDSVSHSQSIDVLVQVARLWLTTADPSGPMTQQARTAVERLSQSEDPNALALVLHDTLAPRVLAWWRLRKPRLEEIPAILIELATDVDADNLDRLNATLTRCRMAGLLENGGISGLGSSWLRAHVGLLVGVKKSKKK
jgi:hypothetical protein